MKRSSGGPYLGQGGFSLPELLIAAAVLAILATLSFGSGAELLARQRVESTARALLEGIQKGRSEAERLGQACGLSLGDQGWQSPVDGALPACQGALSDPGTIQRGAGVEWASNYPPTLRFSANGLVIDGGTAVIWGRGTSLQRCLVMAMPLGVLRLGRYVGDPSTLDNTSCQREEHS